ncbi:MAG: metallophosphoesterase [Anaerolineales bacterium]|nr:MAG: metallophosphoesterase [Anaerolineales bacterium]
MMKVLAVSDQEESLLGSPQIRERFGDTDVVLSCGDLPYTYMEYIAEMLPVPCLYVHGNHDHPLQLSNGTTLHKPGGWHNVDGTTMRLKNGWIIGGLEGCLRYRPYVPYQYSEIELRHKISHMTLSMLRNRLFYGRYIDILITHAPPSGLHDGKDASHQGFKALLRFMERFHPRYLLHGHHHRIGIQKWHTTYQGTEVINIFPYRTLEFGRTQADKDAG